MGKLKHIWTALVLTAVLTVPVVAEENKNDSGCDVCPGAVYFSPEESTEILGDEIRAWALEWWWQGQRSVWIDLDGVLKNAEAPENETHFELQIYGMPDRIFIKSLLDNSVLELVCYAIESKAAVAAGGSAAWSPEIYLFAGHDGQIDLEDSLDEAWRKIRETHIYQWVSRGKDLRETPGEMKARVFRAMQALAPIEINFVR